MAFSSRALSSGPVGSGQSFRFSLVDDAGGLVTVNPTTGQVSAAPRAPLVRDRARGPISAEVEIVDADGVVWRERIVLELAALGLALAPTPATPAQHAAKPYSISADADGRTFTLRRAEPPTPPARARTTRRLATPEGETLVLTMPGARDAGAEIALEDAVVRARWIDADGALHLVFTAATALTPTIFEADGAPDWTALLGGIRFHVLARGPAPLGDRTAKAG
jgi:hypothetical protein